MSTEDTIYKFQDGYILLEDLESWYSRGFVTTEDEIRIFKKKNEECDVHNVGSLIRTYGNVFPFRFGESSHVYNQSQLLEIRFKHTEKMSLDDWPWELKKKLDRNEKQDPKLENPSFMYVNYPLCTVRNESEKGGDFITGQQVVDEMQKLKNAYVLRNWCHLYKKYFSYLHRNQMVDNHVYVPYCNICRLPSPGPIAFFNHLFEEYHIERLAENMVSRSSFQHWADKLEKCVQIHGEQQGHSIFEDKFQITGRSRFRRIPLFHLVREKSNNVDLTHASQLIDLFSRVDPDRLKNENGFLAHLYNLVEFPTFCDSCKINVPQCPYGLTEHILSQNHLSLLTSARTSDVHFWKNYLNIELNATDYGNNDICRILSTNVVPVHNLMNFNLEWNLVDFENRQQSIQVLKSLYEKVIEVEDWHQKLKPIDLSHYDRCVACKVSFFKTTKDFIEHLFSEKHLNFLLQFGISKKSCDWWEKSFKTLIDPNSLQTKIRTRLEASPEKAERGRMREERSRRKAVVKNVLTEILDKVTEMDGNSEMMTEGTIDLIVDEVRSSSQKEVETSDKQTDLQAETETKVDSIEAQISDLFIENMDDLPLQFEQDPNVFSRQEMMKIRSTHNNKFILDPQLGKELLRFKKPDLFYVPMLSHLAQTSEEPMIQAEELETTIRNMMIWMRKPGPKYTSNKLVNWRCDYCSTEENLLKLDSELDAFSHVVSNKHLEKMNFIVPRVDIEFWKEWVLKMKPAAPNMIKKKEARAAFQLFQQEVNSIPTASKATDSPPHNSSLDLTPGKQQEASNIAANYPRVPMLDPIPEDSERVSIRLLSRYADFRASCSEEQLERARLQRVSWTCSYCVDADKNPIHLSNMMYAANHIFSWKHFTMMNNSSTWRDICYWMKWVSTINPTSSEIIVENSPRVPLLDKREDNEQMVSEEFFNETLDDIERSFRSKSLRLSEFNVKKRMKCSFCYNFVTPGELHSLSNALSHILSKRHREQMNFQASEVDLLYWKNWIEKIVGKQIISRKNIENKQTREKPKEKKMEQANLEKPKETLKKKVVFQKMKNNPHVPLLDAPERQQFLLSENKYKLKYNDIAEKLKPLKFPKEENYSLKCRCYHCPDSPEFSNQREVVQHIFNGFHCEWIRYSAELSDFCFYDSLILRLENAQENGDQDRPSPSNVQQFPGGVEVVAQCAIEPQECHPSDPSPRIEPQTSASVHTPPIFTMPSPCLLPLYASNHSYRKPTDTLCIGPTNVQLESVAKFVAENSLDSWRGNTFEKTICGTCQEDLPSLPTLIKHAFSVHHLSRFQLTGGRFYVEDFEWWMSNLNALPICSSGVTQCHLGGLWPIVNSMTGKVFQGFTSKERQLIADVDEQLIVKKTEELLNKFGCCVYCNTWLLEAMDVIHHYVSEQHFVKVRKHHPVKQGDVDVMLNYVKSCQKDKSKCKIM